MTSNEEKALLSKRYKITCEILDSILPYLGGGYAPVVCPR